MERITHTPTSTDVRGTNLSRPESFDVGTRTVTVSEPKLPSYGHRMSLSRTGKPLQETRDEQAPQRWDTGRPVGSYGRFYHDSRRMANTRYDPPNLHVHRQVQQHPQHRWQRQMHHAHPPFAARGMVPMAPGDIHVAPLPKHAAYGSVSRFSTYQRNTPSSSHAHFDQGTRERNPSHSSNHRKHLSVVIIPPNLVIPQEIVPTPVRVDVSPTDQSLQVKRSSVSSEGSSSTHQNKRSKFPVQPSRTSQPGKFDKLDLLCAATLDLGPLQHNPTGCSCPKSKCIALYCDCFKAGRRCNPNHCTCLNCKNTLTESGPDGARSKAIQSILARNPRAFTNAGNSSLKKVPHGEACNCIRSQCLKLYCTCFQAGKACNDGCSCVGCLNTEVDKDGHRALAIEVTLEKRPDAFEKIKPKEVGSGCACKNNRCVRKYCECFRTGLSCTSKCSCRDCENLKGPEEAARESSSKKKIKKVSI